MFSCPGRDAVQMVGQGGDPVTSLVTGVSMQHPVSVSRSGSLPWMKHCRPSYWIARLSVEGWKVTTKGTSIPGEM